jgi:hypothetical protein
MEQEQPLTAFGEEVKAASSFVDDYMRGGRRTGILCANEDCRWHKEVKGGTYTYSHRYSGFVCEDCLHIPLPSSCKNLWEFDTTHFNGEKVHVKNLAHLDQLCRQYGVSNQARENYKSNWDCPPSVRPQETHPELERMLGKAREMGQCDKGSRVSGEWQR